MTEGQKKGLWLWTKTVFFALEGIVLIAISNMKSDTHPNIDYAMGLFMTFIGGICLANLLGFYRD